MTTLALRIRCARVALTLVALALPTTLFAQSTANPRLADSSVASESQAESATPSPSVATSVALPGPRVAPAALVAVTRTTPYAAAPTPPSAGGDVGPNLALVGVGAAAVVVGLLIGGDGGSAVAIGGAVVGLVGLYRYMR
jgi:hypothetical protein